MYTIEHDESGESYITTVLAQHTSLEEVMDTFIGFACEGMDAVYLLSRLQENGFVSFLCNHSIGGALYIFQE